MNLASLAQGNVAARGFYVLLGLLGAFVLSVVDYLTGPQIGLSVFYFIPVLFVTWFAGVQMGYIVSIACGLAWYAVDSVWGLHGVGHALSYWNTLLRTAMLMVVAFLLSRFINLKNELERRIAERTAILQENLTRRAELERALVESEKTYRDLVENATVGVFKTNVWGEVLYVNPAMVAMFEFDSMEEMMSRNVLTYYKDIADRERFIEELKESGRVLNFELQLLTKHQREKTLLVSATLENNIISGMMRDITTMKALEKRLTEIDRLESLGTLAGGIAHDFNNILGIILGHAALVGRFSDRPERVKRGIEAIINASQRGAGLVRQLLTFARKADVLLETVHINTVVNDVARLLAETFPRNITISTRLASGLPLLTADINQLHQVLINLCVNARDAMPAGGTLTLQTRAVQSEEVQRKHPLALSQQYVAVDVTDTGTGMNEEVRRRVFEPFFTTKERGKGTGLGLAVVYGIVESHAGYVDVTSVPGEGSTFSVILPAKEPTGESVEPRVSLPEALPSGSETILLVEDEQQLLELAESILKTHGYTVLTAADGEEAVALYAQRMHEIDLVFSDLGLPKLSGYDVFRSLLQLNPFVRFVLTSGYIDPEQKAEVLTMGAKHVLQKPYTPYDLLTKIRTALDS